MEICQKVYKLQYLKSTKSSWNMTQRLNMSHEQSWILDTGAFSHVTNDLNSLSHYNNYGCPDELVGVDGSGLPIHHLGFTLIPTKSKPLLLNTILHVPSLKHKLIFVSKLFRSNNVTIEFSANDFLVKDSSTGATLMQGHNRSDLYEFLCAVGQKSSNHVALSSSNLDNKLWHKRLGHLAPRTLNFMLRSFQLSNKPSLLISYCNSCNCCKSHNLPFHDSSLKSSKTIDLVIFRVVWKQFNKWSELLCSFCWSLHPIYLAFFN